MRFPRQSAIKQIRKSCLECCSSQVKQIMFCAITDCPLWYLRFGTFPKTRIRNDKRYEKLFNPENFKDGAIYGPEEDVERLSI